VNSVITEDPTAVEYILGNLSVEVRYNISLVAYATLRSEPVNVELRCKCNTKYIATCVICMFLTDSIAHVVLNQQSLSSVDVFSVPGTPTDVQATMPSSTRILVSWRIPPSGEGIDGFEVSFMPVNACPEFQGGREMVNG